MMQRFARVFLGIFLCLLAGSVAVIWWKGIPLGIDFTGGTSLQVRIGVSQPPQEIARLLTEHFTRNGYRGVEVWSHGEGRFEILWRESPQLQGAQTTLSAHLREQLSQLFGEEVVIEQISQVGPTLGAELRAKALWATLTVFLIILVYLAFAFRQVSVPVPSWWYGVGALLALVHDVVVPTALVSLAAHALGVSVDLLFVTALLAVAGYSVNDTIVVFDRIREKLLALGDAAAHTSFARVVDEALRASLMRSINTSLTTLLALLALVVWGAESTRWFAVTLFVGVFAGTISSLLFAPALLVWVAQRRSAAHKGKKKSS